MRGLMLSLFLLGQMLLIPSALACSYLPPEPFELRDDPLDSTPPAAPKVRIRKIKRGVEGDNQGCGGEGTSCDDLGYVDVEVTSLDEDAGVVLTLSGKYPTMLTERLGPVSPGFEQSVRLVWIDGRGDSNLDFDVEVSSVDRAGNVSETSARVHVEHDGNDGCSLSSRGADGVWLALLAAFLLTRRARRVVAPM